MAVTFERCNMLTNVSRPLPTLAVLVIALILVAPFSALAAERERPWCEGGTAMCRGSSSARTRFGSTATLVGTSQVGRQAWLG